MKELSSWCHPRLVRGSVEMTTNVELDGIWLVLSGHDVRVLNELKYDFSDTRTRRG